jgi:hypothetical protein
MIKSFKIGILLLLIGLLSNGMKSQSLVGSRPVAIQENPVTGAPKHSPMVAATMSAILPGLGQAYNKKYWKMPVVYAGFGVLAYFIIDNNKGYQKFKTAYKLRIDDDSSNDNLPRYTTENLRIIKNSYWKNRDLSILLTGVFYALNILDAAVDAHFYTYDVSDDLSFRIRPTVERTAGTNQSAAPGVCLSLNF